MRRTSVWVGLVAVGVAAYLLFAWTGSGDRAPEYVTARVDRGAIQATITATGTINPVVTVQVGTYVSGPIQDLFVDFNSPVRRGQLLAKIDPRPFQVKVDGARADVANVRARLEKDRADATLKAVTLRRTQNLHGQGIVAESDLDTAVAQGQQARAQVTLDQADVASAEARLHEAEVNLAYTDIVSPVDGVVVSRSVDRGQTVAATFQTPTLFQVAEDLTKMQVLASVSESDIGGVAPDEPVTFTVDAYPATQFQGRVAQVRNAPVALQNVVTYDVVVSVDNQEGRLKPGMTANVTITTATAPDALRVVTSALRFRPPAASGTRGAATAAATAPERGPRVWVLDEAGRPTPVPVTTGVADDRYTQVTSGLGEGDAVIVSVRREQTSEPPRGSPFFGGGRHR